MIIQDKTSSLKNKERDKNKDTIRNNGKSKEKSKKRICKEANEDFNVSPHAYDNLTESEDDEEDVEYQNNLNLIERRLLLFSKMKIVSWNVQGMSKTNKGSLTPHHVESGIFHNKITLGDKRWVAVKGTVISENKDVIIVNVYAPHDENEKLIIWETSTLSPYQQWWEEYEIFGWAAFVVKEKLKSLKIDLKKWNHDIFNAENNEMRFLNDHIKVQLQKIELNPMDSEAEHLLMQLTHSRKEAKRREQLKWRLASRINWLRNGDKNTRFFHLAYKIKHHNNFIYGMQIDQVWSEDPSEIKEHGLAYFKSLFARKQSPSQPKIDWSQLGIQKLLEQEASTLDQEFNQEEVWEAVSSFDGGKAPGPDGFTMELFKRGWHFISPEFMQVMAEFHSNASLPKGFNSTFLVLIPKQNAPKDITNLRPISLINAPYKILSKVIANRLRSVMSKLVSENQSAFIVDHHLSDSVMLVNELWHLLKKSKTSALFLKLDFAKAYDSVSHNFLLSTLNGMGFTDRFVSWVSACISDVHFSILINNSPTKEGVMGRGLRQGDPLSPLLFILVTEVMSRMLSSSLNRGFLQGLIVSLSKTALYGINIDQTQLQQYAQLMGCCVGNFLFEYLGIPIGINPRRIGAWQKVIDRFKRKLTGWRGRIPFHPVTLTVSSVWKNIINIQSENNILQVLGPQAWKWKVGGGLQTSFWNDWWIGNARLRHSFVRLYYLSTKPFGKICEFYKNNNDGSFSWDFSFTRPLLPYESTQLQQMLLLLSHITIVPNKDDYIQWVPGDNGQFTVCAATRMMISLPDECPPLWARFYWVKHIPPKVQCFQWLALHNAIPVKGVLLHRHVLMAPGEDLCLWCNEHVESISHLLLHCQWTNEIWKILFLWWGVEWILPESFHLFVRD
uniref:Cysteine-rich receptor-like protein kinase n=1 Tax=Tanacetum cinerariifolium TaxID=118510 RepID=A0A699IIC5_TANCI|nr:cysteine-rich receptor-like protein kinase [Tanacetum cinerariifolium]